MNKCNNGANACDYVMFRSGDGMVRKPKRKFKTSDDAIRAAKSMNAKESTIHKFVAYKCSKCGWYHIGHTSKRLTDKDRDKAKNHYEIRCRQH
jgi:hypothetical protein